MSICMGPVCGLWPCALLVACDSRSPKTVHKITTFREGRDDIFHHFLPNTLDLLLEIGWSVNFSMNSVT